MIKIARKMDCSGCGACSQACGKKCITMEPDQEGFLYPVVNTANCVECGACEKACPILNRVKHGSEPVASFVAFTKEADIRAASSSGGIFTALAQKVLDRNGVVFGAALVEDLSISHVKIESIDDLHRLRGSKYVQSNIGHTFQEAKSALQEGRSVLFSGVGCQIAGLKTYLGKEYENLLTVDVLCHGVPSPKVWQKYLCEQEEQYGEKTINASFRSKAAGWKAFSMELTYRDGGSYRKKLTEDAFMRCFLANICLRPSCHSCWFKDIPRESDLTIGDAWGVGQHMPDMDDDRGTSVVLVNTGKGQRIWNEVVSGLTVRQGTLDTLLPPDSDARRSVKPHPNRKRFFTELDQGKELEQILRLAKKPPLRRLLSWGKRQVKRVIQKIH